MEGHQSIDQLRDQLINFFETNAPGVARQPVEIGAMQAGEPFKSIDCSFLFESEGVALKGMRRIEDAGAAAGGFLGLSAVRR